MQRDKNFIDTEMAQEEIIAILQTAIDAQADEDGIPTLIENVKTFEEAGIITRAYKGLIIRTTDGSEFQITIVQKV